MGFYCFLSGWEFFDSMNLFTDEESHYCYFISPFKIKILQTPFRSLINETMKAVKNYMFSAVICKVK